MVYSNNCFIKKKSDVRWLVVSRSSGEFSTLCPWESFPAKAWPTSQFYPIFSILSSTHTTPCGLRTLHVSTTRATQSFVLPRFLPSFLPLFASHGRARFTTQKIPGHDPDDPDTIQQRFPISRELQYLPDFLCLFILSSIRFQSFPKLKRLEVRLERSVKFLAKIVFPILAVLRKGV